MRSAGACALLVLLVLPGRGRAQDLIIGSKRFTESYVLGEVAKRMLTAAGYRVEHRQGMGGTAITWQALRSGQISCYPDYTGTISQEILKVRGEMTPGAMQRALLPYGVGATGDLGFNDGYGLVMRRAEADRLGVRNISDLRRHLDLRVALTPEFMERADGWRPLSRRYGLRMVNVSGVEHTLGYEAVLYGQTDVKDVYTTDARLADPRLLVLKDDLGFFPKYRAVFLYRLSLPAGALAALRTLEGEIDEAEMIRMNAVAERKKDYTAAAALFAGPAARGPEARQAEWSAAKIARLTLLHLRLVGISLVLAIIVGLPLGIVASRPGALGHAIIGAAGVIQTIPSLALLALLVPVPGLGIRVTTAIVALFLYSLLPIIRNTAAGLQDIPRSLRESATAMGLPPGARLVKVYLPLASRTILAGIKTSAVINVGTATLAALIGAECLGTPIISGLNLLDTPTILQGAIPAALLAIGVQLLFDGLDLIIIPKGLRLGPNP